MAASFVLPSFNRITVARAPSSARVVRAAILRASPVADGSINDLDRLSEDLGLGLRERAQLEGLLAAGLGHAISPGLVARATTVAELMAALR